MPELRRVFVIGVGMTKFEKPGSRDWDYPQMGKVAAERALKDACIDYSEVEQACVGYCYGDSTCGQRAVYSLGMTGIPVYNVNNNCATGSTALSMARQFVAGGISNCCLALGFEKMEKGSLGLKYTDRTNPMDKHLEVMSTLRDFTSAPFAAQMFGNAGLEHMEKYGTRPEHFAKIAYKNHKNSVNNPYSQFRDVYTLEEISKSPAIHGPLTKLQCCPTSDGGAAAVVASEEFVIAHGLQGQAIELVGMGMATDPPTTLTEKSCIKIVGYDMTRRAAEKAFTQSKVSPNDIQVVELHDCFSANELITYEALGLCKEGEAGAFIDRGDNTYGGKVVVNPSGGLISKGHPLGATGLAQCAEICWQLRGEAGPRQVNNAILGMTHNLGLGGAAVVTIYKRPVEWKSIPPRRAISGGAAPPPDGFEDTPKPSAAVKGVAEHFQDLAQSMKANPAASSKISGVFQWNISGEWWVIDAKSTNPVYQGQHSAPDCTLTISSDDFVSMMSGKSDPQKLFVSGKLKVAGNMGMVMKLGPILRSKL